MSDSMSGVFLCSGFSARRSSATHAFCKPVNIRIYSAPPPVRMRTVTYEMKFIEGTDQPQSVEDWQLAKAYQSPYNNERSFSFNVGTLKLELEDLFNQIRRHFYRVVLKGESCVPRATGFFRLMNQNTTTRRYVLNDTTLVRVSLIHHLQHITPDATGVHVIQRAAVRYQGEILDNRGEPNPHLEYRGRFVGVEHEYEDGRYLITVALEHFKRQDVRDQLIATLT